MKKEIHPEYVECSVSCASCGNTFTTRSTRGTIRVDLCAKCHPFFTGEQRLVDTGGRVERFMRRMNRTKGTEVPPEEATEAAASTAS